jgi:hypothetical protein
MQFSRKPPAVDSNDEQENESGGDNEDEGEGQVEDGGVVKGWCRLIRGAVLRILTWKKL